MKCATDAAHIVGMTEVEQMNTEHLSFRASRPLVAALSERVQQAGCSVSEYLRSIARERVGLQ